MLHKLDVIATFCFCILEGINLWCVVLVFCVYALYLKFWGSVSSSRSTTLFLSEACFYFQVKYVYPMSIFLVWVTEQLQFSCLRIT